MKRVIILFAATLLLIGSSLNAQPGMGYPPGKPMKGQGFSQNKMMGGPMQMNRMERMKTMLNLTDEQAAKISDLRFAHETLAIDTRSEIQKNKLIVRKMMADNEIDQEKLLKITSENSELQGKIKLSRTTMWLEVYNMLDDAQKEKWTNTFGQFGQNGNSKKFHKSGRGGFGNNNCGGRFNQPRVR